MRIYTPLVRAAAICLAATRVAAQSGASCPASPGAAFGVVGYQCANCGFSRSSDGRPAFSFMAEPVVVESAGGSKILAGDVIEAVNGKPITTRAGSDAFTYPSASENTITVRRGRDRQTIRIAIPESASRDTCDRGVRGATGAGGGAGFGAGTGAGRAAGVGSGASAGAGAGSGVGRSVHLRGIQPGDGSAPMIIVDGVVVSGGSAAAGGAGAKTSTFGFAVGCEPSCTAATDVDGPLMYTYYKYDSPPPIVAVRSGSAAEAAGLRVGDLLVKIGGHSIVDPEGALALARIDKPQYTYGTIDTNAGTAKSVRLTIRRDGKDLDYVVTVPR